jgi:hypothetical protein
MGFLLDDLAFVVFSHAAWFGCFTLAEELRVFRILIVLGNTFDIPERKEFLSLSALTDGFHFDRGTFVFLQFFDVLLSIRPVALKAFFLAFAADPDIDHVRYLDDIDSSAIEADIPPLIEKLLLDLHMVICTMRAVMMLGVSLLCEETKNTLGFGSEAYSS